MPKKYEILREDSIQVDASHTLYRIRALIDIPMRHIIAGELGGYIEHEDNLSHDGQAWVGGDALVYEDARVTEDALAHGRCWVYGCAALRGRAIVGGDSHVCDQAVVAGQASISGRCVIHGDAVVGGDALVSGESSLPAGARIYARDLVYFFSITDCVSPNAITLYNDTQNIIRADANDFSGTLEQYEAHVAEKARERPSPMLPVLIDMGRKRIESARARCHNHQIKAAYNG